MVRQAPVICVMAPPIHLGASMAMAAFRVIIVDKSVTVGARAGRDVTKRSLQWNIS